jgi:hypothetical protein
LDSLVEDGLPMVGVLLRSRKIIGCDPKGYLSEACRLKLVVASTQVACDLARLLFGNQIVSIRLFMSTFALAHSDPFCRY